jgi:Tfp pilus assembly PilM family ATPase
VASWLVIDWDQDQFHIVSAQSSRRGVQVVKAASWTHPEPFTPSTAERVGKALRDFLKAAKIPSAPVIIGLGRDRIFLKELRFPAIEAHEEATLVRFQTGKELTESVDNYSIDYVHMNQGAGERQVMTAALRRDLLTMLQTLCQAAGLKLHAVTPKLFGAGAVLERALRPDPSPLTANRLNVVLSVGQRWAELCFFRGQRLLQAQALANGPLLAAEVKRNLAVFRAQQAVNMDVSGPDCLYLFGEDKSGVQTLENGVTNLPIRLLEPLRAEPEVSAEVKNRAALAGAVGLAELWSQAVQKPINLAAPKRLQAPVSVTRQRGIVLGAVAAVVLIASIAGMWWYLSKQRAEISRLAQARIDLDTEFAKYNQDRVDLDAYKEWEHTTVPWLDEM